MPDAPFHYRIAGAYFESCNCDAICPCRTVGGVVGGSSTHGVCFGILSWHVCNGHANDIPVDGLNAALVYSYSDDEEGSPWGFNLHVDERGDDAQRAALADILVGNVGGKLVLALPWSASPASSSGSRRAASSSGVSDDTTRSGSASSTSSRRRASSRPSSASRASFPATTSPARSCTPSGWPSPTIRSSGT